MGKRAKGEGAIFKRKDGTWQGELLLGYSVEGKPRRKYFYGKTQKEVKEKLETVKFEISRGIFSDAKQTVKDYLTEYLKERQNQVSKRSYTLYTLWAEKHITPEVGAIKLRELKPMHVQKMLSSIRAKSAATSAKRNNKPNSSAGIRTANQCRTFLYSALKQAVRWELLNRNVVEAVDPLKAVKSDFTLWTSAEASNFLDTARPHRLYALFCLAISTGMRRGEILGLRWEDINLTDGIVHVRESLKLDGNRITFGTPKTEGSKRVVHISTDVVETLIKHRTLQDSERTRLKLRRPDRDSVFTSAFGTPIHPRNLARDFKRLQTQVSEGVREIGLHDLRHFHASLAIQQGMDAKVLADRLGHSRASLTLDVYTHLFDSQRVNSAVDISALTSKSVATLN